MDDAYRPKSLLSLEAFFINDIAIYHSNWDDNDAKVVCRQLGFGVEGAQATIYGFFKSSVRDHYIDDVVCFGNEARLLDCRHSSTCCSTSTRNAAGVTCPTPTDRKIIGRLLSWKEITDDHQNKNPSWFICQS